GAVFKSANLQGVDLNHMDIHKSDFTGANLVDADLRGAHLGKVKLTGANITGCKLWKITSAGWSIANIQCGYAYWDKNGKEKTIYRAHEFERIFAESITVELRYPYRLADH